MLREIYRGRLWAARPIRVIEDAGDLLASWCPKGTVRAAPVTPPSRPDPEERGERVAQLFARGDWDMGTHVWTCRP